MLTLECLLKRINPGTCIVIRHGDTIDTLQHVVEQPILMGNLLMLSLVRAFPVVIRCWGVIVKVKLPPSRPNPIPTHFLIPLYF